MQTARLRCGEIVFRRIKNISSTQFYGAKFIDQSETCTSLVNKSNLIQFFFELLTLFLFHEKYFLAEDNKT